MSTTAAFDMLQGQLDGFCRCDEPLAKHTTFRIGGAAALYVECDSLSDLKLVLHACRTEGIEWTVLGKGSNVLASDTGYDGAVIVLGRDFKRHGRDDTRIIAGAGVSLAAIVQEAFARALTGMEFAVGIPGTLGGALVMNAGTREEWIGNVVESVKMVRPDGELVLLRHDEVSWGYRHTDLARRGVVIEAVLGLNEGDEWRIRQTMEAALRRRRRNQPLALPNAGSVFANPDGESCGRIIEDCGLKGTRIGGAEISEVHANFIVNVGGAKAADVVALMRLARDRVGEAYGIELRPEIRFLGSFDGS